MHLLKTNIFIVSRTKKNCNKKIKKILEKDYLKFTVYIFISIIY